MKIVGICGEMGSGKDTLGEMLGGTKVSFADPLKKVCAYVFDIPVEDMNTQEGKASVHPNGYGLTNRRILQIVGTDMFRELINTDVWIDKFKRTAGQHDYVVVTDLRFDNEAQVILDLGGIVLEVVRPNNPIANPSGKSMLSTITNLFNPKPTEVHASESGISEHLITARVHNNGSIEDLSDTLNKLCRM